MATFERYREFIKRLSPTVLSSGWGERLQGTIAGLVWDVIADGGTNAVKSPWLTLLTQQPIDALPVIADERKLFRYLVETDEQWQARLDRAWEIWEAGGSENEIEAQLAAAGYVAELHSPVDWNRSPVDWPSQFWVLLTDPGPFGAAAIVGEPTTIAGQHLCGVSGPKENVAEIRNIIATFKAGHVVCRQIIILLGDGAICGTGETAGDHLCGGGGVAFIGTGIQPT